ncbi:hypothetical protein GCM10012285_14130 [Streptomyces kronopolitis]|uniref:Uncharacterized protein n=1 Tax=Streptomyces kronopolitis TaxID=1612435 RepID=A0ABQ2J6B4_9ACTN|nr:hypothetical protein GCM10012285_14130 [Streptomyces kronopolitis]
MAAHGGNARAPTPRRLKSAVDSGARGAGFGGFCAGGKAGPVAIRGPRTVAPRAHGE